MSIETASSRKSSDGIVLLGKPLRYNLNSDAYSIPATKLKARKTTSA
ncbi:MAG: hypothetical protein ACLVJ6_13890 [Merdibacter sp.]